MILSELVAFKNALEETSLTSTEEAVDLNLSNVINLVETQPSQIGKFLTELKEQHNKIDDEILQFKNKINSLLSEVKKQIEVQEKPWFQESYRLYEEEMKNEHHDYILNRRPRLTPETTLRSRLRNYADWRYPAMIIRPGLEDFITDLVACDPLYIIDLNQHLLGKVVFKFTPEYQSRLRAYHITENLDEPILDRIPNNQFGVCLVYNFFNFRPFEYIQKYLLEIYTKLRPGGVLIMTFNDCDRAAGVKLAETHYACYTPGYLVNKWAETIGYDRPFTWNDGGPSTYLEIRKPGNLDSLRGGQSLAKVLPRILSEDELREKELKRLQEEEEWRQQQLNKN